MIVTFNMIFNRIRDYFDMDIKATRLNWYIIAVKDNSRLTAYLVKSVSTMLPPGTETPVSGSPFIMMLQQ